MACRPKVNKYCKRFDWPVGPSFSRKKYPDGGAKMLASEWVRRGAHFYAMFVSGGQSVETFRFSEEQLNSYTPTEEFLIWATGLSLEDKSFDAAVKVAKYRPTNP